MAPKKKEYSFHLRETVIKRFLNGDSEHDIAGEMIIPRNSVHYNAGYLRSGFEYFLKGFGPVHSPTQINFSPSRSQRALSNQHPFNIQVHFHPRKNPKKSQKKRKIKINFVKR